LLLAGHFGEPAGFDLLKSTGDALAESFGVLVALEHQAQRFANHLAGVIVEAKFDLLAGVLVYSSRDGVSEMCMAMFSSNPSDDRNWDNDLKSLSLRLSPRRVCDWRPGDQATGACVYK
jgi:hypothetical protein